MTGVFTDNQPDFTWLAPYEEKVFVQNFLPYSELGMVQNANTQLALKLVRESGQLQLGVYAIAPLNHIVVELSADHQPLYETQLTLKPGESWQQTLPENRRRALNPQSENRREPAAAGLSGTYYPTDAAARTSYSARVTGSDPQWRRALFYRPAP